MPELSSYFFCENGRPNQTDETSDVKHNIHEDKQEATDEKIHKLVDVPYGFLESKLVLAKVHYVLKGQVSFQEYQKQAKLNEADQEELPRTTHRTIVYVRVLVAVVGAETGPTKLVLTAGAFHVPTPTVLLDQLAAHGTGLTRENFAQVSEGFGAA